jgi:AraC-like DNA-binding protein
MSRLAAIQAKSSWRRPVPSREIVACMKAHVQRVTPSREASFVFRVKADRRFARGWHCHPEYELTYIVSSRGRRFVGDSIETYESGDCVLLGSNLPHTWLSEPSAGLHRAIVVQFDASLLGGSLATAPELAAVAALLRRSAMGLRITGRTRDEVARRLLAMRRLRGLDRLLELLRALQAMALGRGDVRPIARHAPAQPPDASQLRRIDRVLAYLEERHAGPIAQRDVARLLGMSTAGFSRFFRRATGRTFVAYLAELRISRAARLLIDTDLPVLDVALRSGFANLSNFNRRFRALKGMTPRELRKRHAEAEGQ